MKSIDELLEKTEWKNRRNELQDMADTCASISRTIAQSVAILLDGYKRLTPQESWEENVRNTIDYGNRRQAKRITTVSYKDFILELGAVLAIGAWLPDGDLDLNIPSLQEAQDGFRELVRRVVEGTSCDMRNRGAELFHRIVLWKASQVLAVKEPFFTGVVGLKGKSLKDHEIEWLAEFLLELVELDELVERGKRNSS